VGYITLGARQLTSAPDTTGRNTGNYTAYFSTQVLGCNVPQFEIYHALVTDVPGLATATIYLNVQQWSFTAPGFGGSEWDPEQPLYVRPGDEVFFFWSTGTGTPPDVTCWLRYDDTLSVNAHYRGPF
jgi:hypothetical protein